MSSERWVEPLIVRKFRSADLFLPQNRTRWRFLSEDLRRAIREAMKLESRPEWRRIVLHGSGSHSGNAELLATSVRRRFPALSAPAYHFVIGNGSYSGDGEIELGPRWREQRPSTSFDLPDLNLSSVSVCMIGQFQETGPTRRQWLALDELVTYLKAQLGGLVLVSHQEMESTAIGCPGPLVAREHLDQVGP